MASRNPLGDRSWNALGIVGFVGFTLAVATAHANPATEYELSIYAATPVVFWLGIALAFVAGTLIAFWAPDRRNRFLGILLGGMASAAVVGLPLLRGYYFHGTADEHAHVGWTKAIIDGSMLPFDLIYPGVHTVAAFVDGLTGYPIWRSVLLVPLVFVVVYLVFVPLVVRELVDSERATTIGAFAAFLLVPTHPIAVGTIHAHPSTQAILFAPVVLFLLVRYLRSAKSSVWHGVSSTGIALSLAVLAIILYHPQQGVNVLILLGVISIGQRLHERASDRSDAFHRRVHSVTVLGLVAFLLWALQHAGIVDSIVTAVGAVSEFLFGASTDPGSAVASQTGALQAIGVSLPVFYLKMFLVSTVFVILTGLVVLAAFGDRFEVPGARVDTATVGRYFGVALLAMVPVFLTYYVADVGVYYFREAGFMLMVGSILGAAGVAYWSGRRSVTSRRRVVNVAVVGGFALMLVLSVMLVFNSPYIHRANKHATEAEIQGYATAFEVTDEEAWLAGVRKKPRTYYESIVGMASNGRRDGTVDGATLRDLQQHRTAPYYLVLTQSIVERETVAYRGYRYTMGDLTAPDRQVDVDLIHSNGGLTLYHVP